MALVTFSSVYPFFSPGLRLVYLTIQATLASLMNIPLDSSSIATPLRPFCKTTGTHG